MNHSCSSNTCKILNPALTGLLGYEELIKRITKIDKSYFVAIENFDIKRLKCDEILTYQRRFPYVVFYHTRNEKARKRFYKTFIYEKGGNSLLGAMAHGSAH